MKKSTIIILMFVFILSGSVAALAQSSNSTCTQIESSIKTEIPHWKIVGKGCSSSSCTSIFRLEYNDDTAHVFAFYKKSTKEAAKFFNSFSLKTEILETKTLNLGEEDRVWKGEYSTGVDFRKGRIVVRIAASTIEQAKEVAISVANGIVGAECVALASSK